MKQTLETLKSWDGFISKEGFFYKEKKWLEERVDDDLYIEAFAFDKLSIDVEKALRRENIKGNYNNKNYVLIEQLGFISLKKKDDQTIEVLFPDYTKCKHDITKEQLDTLLKVIEINEKEVHEEFYKPKVRKLIK